MGARTAAAIGQPETGNREPGTFWWGGTTMTYIIAEPCITVKDRA